MRKTREIWVRFQDQQEYSENEEKLYELLGNAPGYCIVKAYLKDTNSYKRLPACFDKRKIASLVNAFGEENVRCVETSADSWDMHVLPRIVQIMPCSQNIYAVFQNPGGGEAKSKIMVYALCSDSEVYPLWFDSQLGLCSLHDAIYEVDHYELEGGEVYAPNDWTVSSGRTQVWSKSEMAG